jgi:hypothetical protein
MTNSVRWRPRPVPLAPLAVASVGAASLAMARKLLGTGDDMLSRLRGVAGNNILLLLGEAAQLPWIDGAVYLGRDPASPSLLLPTHSEPEIAPALFERAILARFPELAAPLAVLPGDSLVVSACEARPVERARLAAWLEELP